MRDLEMQETTKEQAEDMAKRTAQETLDLVRQTTQVIKLAEDRGRALAGQGQELAQRAVDELKIAEKRIASLEEQLLRAETQAMESQHALQRVYDELKRTLGDHPLSMPSIGRSRAA
jgi:hypothetical protein